MPAIRKFDDNFVKRTGDTMTGPLTIDAGSNTPTLDIAGDDVGPRWTGVHNSNIDVFKPSPNAVRFDINPLTGDGSSNAQVTMFRGTDTTGIVAFDLYKGNGSPVVNARFREGVIKLREKGAAIVDTSEFGQVWVKDTTPNTLFFTNDDGTDFQLGLSGAAGLWEVDGAETQLITADEIDMQSKKILNVTNPTADQDAATKKYHDDNTISIGENGARDPEIFSRNVGSLFGIITGAGSAIVPNGFILYNGNSGFTSATYESKINVDSVVPSSGALWFQCKIFDSTSTDLIAETGSFRLAGIKTFTVNSGSVSTSADEWILQVNRADFSATPVGSITLHSFYFKTEEA